MALSVVDCGAFASQSGFEELNSQYCVTAENTQCMQTV